MTFIMELTVVIIQLSAVLYLSSAVSGCMETELPRTKVAEELVFRDIFFTDINVTEYKLVFSFCLSC